MTPGTTIPAALVGVWEGARVWMDDSGLDTDHGVVFERATDGRWWATFPRHRLSAAGPDHREIGLSRMSLDLTHRPTRLEVVARLAEALGWPAHAGARWEEREPATVPPVWMLTADGRRYEFFGVCAWRAVPGLAGLDTRDPASLPNVRALAIVCQHVFGGLS